MRGAPPQPFWDVLAEVMAAGEALPRAVRIGRAQPLGAADAKSLRQMARLLDTTLIFDATTITLPPQIAAWARVSHKREQAGIKVQLRLRVGEGGVDRVMVTGAAGNDNPYFRALLDLALHEAIFAAGVEEGERRARARAAPPHTATQPLRKAG